MLLLANNNFIWINIYGLLFIAIIMIPNIIFAIKCKDGFINKYNNKTIETLEQIGRFGSFIFMIINIKYLSFGFISETAFSIYIIINSILILSYCSIWAICFKQNSIFRSLSLAIIPSIVFIFSGILTRSIILLIFAIIFAPCHILISYKNAKE